MVWFSTLSHKLLTVGRPFNGAELSGWCFTIFSNRFQLRSRQRLRSLSATSGNSLLTIGSLVVLVPLPWRLLLQVLSLSGVRGVFVLVEHHFPRCCCFFFECVLSARLDDVCGFSTESRRVDNGHYCLLSSSLATTGRSTKWNSFAILGRAHVHTHTCLLLSRRRRRGSGLQERKKSLSGIKLERVAAGTHDDAHRWENYSTHGKLTFFFQK